MEREFRFKIWDKVKCKRHYGNRLFIVVQRHYYEDDTHKVYMYLCEDPLSERKEQFAEDDLIRGASV